MIGQALWKNLKVLVEIDSQIKQLKEEIAEKNKLITNNQVSIPRLNDEIDQAKKNCLETKKKVDEEELIANDFKEKEETKKKALDKTKNEKEYRAIEKEIKSISQKRIDQEDVLIKTWHQYDLIKKQTEEEQEAKEKQIQEIEEKINLQQKEILDLNEKLTKLNDDRNLALKHIPAEWLHKYNRMKENVPNPIVPVIENSCSACYYHVIRQDLQKLKNAGVLLCRNCYRFLYYDKEEEKETKEASY